jgi:hypothetical protein
MTPLAIAPGIADETVSFSVQANATLRERIILGQYPHVVRLFYLTSGRDPAVARQERAASSELS